MAMAKLMNKLQRICAKRRPDFVSLGQIDGRLYFVDTWKREVVCISRDHVDGRERLVCIIKL